MSTSNLFSRRDFFATVLREGWVRKQSKYLRKWRQRWLVLTPDCLWTFRRPQDYASLPTEKIALAACVSVQSSGDSLSEFCIDTLSRKYFFTTSDQLSKDAWVNAIACALFSSPTYDDD